MRQARLVIASILVLSGIALITVALTTQLGRHDEFAPYLPTYLASAFAASVLIVSGLVFGVSGIRDPSRDRQKPLRAIRWWWPLVGLMLIGISIWSTIAILLPISYDAPDPTKRVELKIDSVKTALTVGAGAGGAIALFLGIRKQWLGERTQLHSEFDATERRATELYTKAAEQLGHDKAAVRLAGLYALERVGQGNSGLRQTVMDVICAYLRMPVDPDETQNIPDGSTEHVARMVKQQDRQVRLTAQRLITRHLTRPHSETVAPDTFWTDMDVDLSGALLEFMTFENCELRRGNFTHARFSAPAAFIRVTFKGEPWGTHGPGGVGGATFDHVVFEQSVTFEDVTFEGDVSFFGVAFEGVAYFGGVKVAGEGSFTEATFARRAHFEGSTFTGTAMFLNTEFDEAASFASDTIYDSATTFQGLTDFVGAEFHQGASFLGVSCKPPVWDGDHLLQGFSLRDARVKADSRLDHIWPTGWLEEPDPFKHEYNCLIQGSATVRREDSSSRSRNNWRFKRRRSSVEPESALPTTEEG